MTQTRDRNPLKQITATTRNCLILFLSNNCTDAALGAAAAAGVSINATTGIWQGGGGHNPGDLGEDLRNIRN